MKYEPTAPLLYIAGAYSGDTVTNIALAEKASIELIRNGFHVVTPHKNTSGYEQYEDDAVSVSTWLEMNLNILSRCDGIYMLLNWRGSMDAIRELHFAFDNGIAKIREEFHPSNEFTPGDFVAVYDTEFYRSRR